MAASLPLELLFEIATHLRTDRVSLLPCTHVCRHWQAALEPLVFNNLAVYSDGYHKEKGRRGISLTHFKNSHPAVVPYGETGFEGWSTTSLSPANYWTGPQVKTRIIA